MNEASKQLPANHTNTTKSISLQILSYISGTFALFVLSMFVLVTASLPIYPLHSPELDFSMHIASIFVAVIIAISFGVDALYSRYEPPAKKGAARVISVFFVVVLSLITLYMSFGWGASLFAGGLGTDTFTFVMKWALPFVLVSFVLWIARITSGSKKIRLISHGVFLAVLVVMTVLSFFPPFTL